MTIAVQHRKPSTLGDVIGQVKEAFDAMGNMCPVMIGKYYLSNNVGGAGARVVFAPEFDGGGGIEPPLQFGDGAAMRHSCTVQVRAAESGDDVERMKAVYALTDLVVEAIQTAGTGRIQWGSLEDASPTDVDGYGAEVRFHFTFVRDILHDGDRWGLPPAPADTTDELPLPPPGLPGTVDTLNVTVEPPE